MFSIKKIFEIFYTNLARRVERELFTFYKICPRFQQIEFLLQYEQPVENFLLVYSHCEKHWNYQRIENKSSRKASLYT